MCPQLIGFAMNTSRDFFGGFGRRLIIRGREEKRVFVHLAAAVNNIKSVAMILIRTTTEYFIISEVAAIDFALCALDA